MVVGLRLAPTSEGKYLETGAQESGDPVIADRGFARPEELEGVKQGGRYFLARLASRSLRLLDARGHVLPCNDLLMAAAAQAGVDRPVWIGHSRRAGWKPVPARL